MLGFCQQVVQEFPLFAAIVMLSPGPNILVCLGLTLGQTQPRGLSALTSSLELYTHAEF